MHALRTRFKKEIVSEFLPPARKSNRVIIFCGGMPTYPKGTNYLEFFSQKGFWVFFPRYRGTWESGGRFLVKSPHLDILDVISQLPKGFTDIGSGKKYKISSPKIYIIGISFGGPAAILASRDKRVQKSVCIYPVVDWTAPSKNEPMDKMEKVIRQAFGEGYRFSSADWKKLAEGKFYNPINHIKEIDGRKLYIMHAKDDRTVDYRPVEKFARATGAKLWLLPKGGHGGWDLTKPKFYKKIKEFLR